MYQLGGTILVLRGTRSALWFDLVSGEYVGRYGTKYALSHVGSSYVLAAPNGEVTTFNDFFSANPGLFNSLTTAGGQTLSVATYASGTALGIRELQRSYTSGGVTTTESLLYSFTGSDLAGVLWRRSTDGGATWTGVRQVAYAYYGPSDSNGLAGDLQTATIQQWSGSA